MRELGAIGLVLIVACSSAPSAPNAERTLPEPISFRELPAPPEEVPVGQRLVVPVKSCIVEGSNPPQEAPPGILMSQEMAMRAGRLKVAYDELRGLYEVDLVTMGKERTVYERHLKAADVEIALWRQRARRSWWEQNRGTVGLVLGIVTGAALAVGMAAAVDGVSQ
jgi:hypothetical protein